MLNASEIRYKEDAETVSFKFPDTLSIGVAKLYLEFTGVLNNKMKGFYRSKYTSLNGEERYAAVTQFQVCYFSSETIKISSKCTIAMNKSYSEVAMETVERGQ